MAENAKMMRSVLVSLESLSSSKQDSLSSPLPSAKSDKGFSGGKRRVRGEEELKFSSSLSDKNYGKLVQALSNPRSDVRVSR